MTALRTKAERDRARADLVTVLREAGAPVMVGDLIATAYGLREVQPGSRVYTWAMTDLRALDRAQVIRTCWVDTFYMGYELATDETRAADEDEAEVCRLMARWEPAD